MRILLFLLITSFVFVANPSSSFAQKETVPAAKKSKRSKSKKGSGDKELDKYFYGGGSKKDKNKKGKKEKETTQSVDGKIVDTKALLKSKGVNTGKTTSGGVSTNKTNNATYRPVYVGNKVVTGSIENVQGFRICVYNGIKREEAMQKKVEFMKAYPGIRSYLSYNTPNYKINVGDFEDKKDAEKQLKTVKKKFENAVIVPEVVTAKKIYIYKK
jgi:hypothetical protein